MAGYLEVTVKYRYFVSDETLRESYGSLDLDEAAGIDQIGYQAAPQMVAEDLQQVDWTITVNPVKE